jgi:hypothetical protein
MINVNAKRCIEEGCNNLPLIDVSKNILLEIILKKIFQIINGFLINH